MRPVAVLLILAQLSWSCASSSRVESVKEPTLVFGPPPAGTVPVPVVLREFRNSASISTFDIIPDGRYDRGIRRRGSPPAPGAAGSGSTPNPDGGGEEQRPPAPVEPGLVAREVTETLLVESGRFRVIPEFKLREALASPDATEVVPLAQAARQVGVRYILYGDLTQFELRQKRSYWKVPLWALLLIGALLIKDKDTRAWALNTILRIMIYTPLNSPFWDKGLGWEDLILEVEVALTLRLVDSQTGLVVHTSEAEITRTETVRNLDLIVWNSDKRLKITSSNAGKQIRFAAHRALSDLFEQAFARLDAGAPVVDGRKAGDR